MPPSLLSPQKKKVPLTLASINLWKKRNTRSQKAHGQDNQIRKINGPGIGIERKVLQEFRHLGEFRRHDY